MTRSNPCLVCGRIDDLRDIEPTGILMDSLVQWECSCSNTRVAPVRQVGLVAPDTLARAEARMHPAIAAGASK